MYSNKIFSVTTTTSLPLISNAMKLLNNSTEQIITLLNHLQVLVQYQFKHLILSPNKNTMSKLLNNLIFNFVILTKF